MKKNIITVALLAVLATMAVSCQKEDADITSANPSTVIAENDAVRSVVYTIDGVTYRLTLVGDQAWRDFLLRMFALAEEGRTVTFRNEEAASRVIPSKLVETFTTSNKEEAYMQEGDCLLAYNGSELCGMTEKSDDNLFYLSVANCGNTRLSFAIQRGEELIALSGDQMTYQTDAVIGTVDEPTMINFAEVSYQVEGAWYDLLGRKLDKRPQLPGIYIFNRQKIMIK